MPRKGQSKYIGKFKEGEMYGNWKILSPEITIVKGYAQVKCLCTECNKTKTLVSCNHLKNGKTTRCGKNCGYKHTREKNPAWKGYKEISGKFISQIKRRSNKRGLKCDIELKDIWGLYNKQNRKCALSGVNITFGKTASLDRIDSLKGYTKDNIQLVHKHVNRMKNKFNNEYFIEMCKKIAEQN